MNDVDVMRNMNHCIKQECEECYYYGGMTQQCQFNLMRDANVIMKQQHDALKSFSEELAKLKAENERLKPLLKYNFEEDKLVEAVNGIIYACMDDFDDYDEGGHAYRRMISVLLSFGSMLPGQYKVEIRGIECPPKLVKE